MGGAAHLGDDRVQRSRTGRPRHAHVEALVLRQFDNAAARNTQENPLARRRAHDAVAVYQNKPGSSDISFDLSLAVELGIATFLAKLPPGAIDAGLENLTSILAEEERGPWREEMSLAIASCTGGNAQKHEGEE